jgi:glycine/D-amino acid oxidase-like deaminating enzyme
VIAGKLARFLPDFAGAPTRLFWAAIARAARTAASSSGADPRLPGLFWAAGLGGHGVTTAAAVGRRVAAALLRRRGSG